MLVLYMRHQIERLRSFANSMTEPRYSRWARSAKARDYEVLSRRYINAHADESHDSVRSCIRAKERAVVWLVIGQPENIKMVPIAAFCSEDLESSCKVFTTKMMEHVQANMTSTDISALATAAVSSNSVSVDGMA